MRAHGCGLTLSVVACLLVLVLPALAEQIPPGYDFLPDARVSGALLVNSRPGTGGATALMRQSLSEVRPFFDQLRLLGALRDKNDQRLEFLFTAIVRGSMVQGLGVAATEPGRGTVGYAFDNPQTIAQTLPALLGLAGSAVQDPTRGLNWPTQSFAHNLPVLVRIWNSAVTARHVVQERLDHALADLKQAGEIWRQTTQARQRPIERSHADWTEAIRGTRTIVDTRTGERADIDLGYAHAIVRKLNEREPDRYREVPLRELIH